MTPLHHTLYRLGYTDCRTERGKTAALHHVPNGNALRTGIEVDGAQVTWETQSTHYGADSVRAVKAALEAWVRERRLAAVLGCDGQAARP